MKSLDFASNNRVAFIRSVGAPSAAKQFVVDCSCVLLVLAIVALLIYARS